MSDTTSEDRRAFFEFLDMLRGEVDSMQTTLARVRAGDGDDMAERLAGLTAVAEAGERVREFVAMLNAAVDYPDQFEAEYVARQPSNAVYATVN